MCKLQFNLCFLSYSFILWFFFSVEHVAFCSFIRQKNQCWNVCDITKYNILSDAFVTLVIEKVTLRSHCFAVLISHSPFHSRRFAAIVSKPTFPSHRFEANVSQLLFRRFHFAITISKPTFRSRRFDSYSHLNIYKQKRMYAHLYIKIKKHIHIKTNYILRVTNVKQ